eukprot:jgi/Botrbrau1/8007/Bobra.384_2s0030.2
MEGYRFVLKAFSLLLIVARAYAEVTLSGKAFGAGYLQNCTVILTVGTVNQTTTTDATGSFSFKVPDLTSPQQLTGGLLYMPNGPQCIDTATHQQVPLDMGALLPTYAAGAPAVATINAITTLSYYTKKNFNAPQIKPYAYFFGGQDFTANVFYKTFGSYLGIGNSEMGGTTDFIKGILSMDKEVKDELKGQALNNEILNSLTIGSSGLSGFKPGVTPKQAAEAMVVATFPAGASYLKQGLSFDLTRVDSLTAVFNKALGGTPQDLVNAAANTLSIMNTQLKNLGDSTPSAETLNRMAQIVYAGQTVIAPAVHELATGSMSVKDWTDAYGSAAALENVYTKAGKIPGVLGAVAPAPAPIAQLGPITTAVGPSGIVAAQGVGANTVLVPGRRLLKAL